MPRLLFAASLLLSWCALAQVELADLESSTFNASANPSLGAVLGGKAYFFADDPDPTRRALWKTDGTPAGTSRVVALPPLLEPRSLAAGTSRLFFITLDAETGTSQLWTSDGVSTATPVASILPDLPAVYTAGGHRTLATAGDNAVFTAGPTTNALTLWGSDGTAAGTTDLGITVGSNDLGPTLLRPFANALVTEAGPSRREVWFTNGTDAGTILVSQSPANTPLGLSVELGDAWWPTNGKLWSWDGTFPVSLRSVSSVSNAWPASSLNGTFYFAWGSSFLQSNGVTYTNANCGLPAAQPSTMRSAGSFLYVLTNSPPYAALTVFDGGTCAPAPLPSGGSFTSNTLTPLGTRMLFPMSTASQGEELFAAEGLQVSALGDLWPGSGSSSPVLLTALGTQELFSANDGVLGRELYITDGTAGGTSLVKDVNGNVLGNGSAPTAFALAPNGGVAFTATTADAGRQVWFTDGGAPSRLTSLPQELAGPLASVGGVLLAGDGTGALYALDATAPSGVTLVVSTSTPSRFAVAGPALFFVSGSQLWKSDGTAAGTFAVRPLSGPPVAGPIAVGTHVLVLEGVTLHSDDGSVHQVLSTTVTAPPVPGPGGRAWFGTREGGLWSTDGTIAGTVQEATIGELPCGVAHAAGAALALGGDAGTRLWRAGADAGLLLMDFGLTGAHDLTELGAFTVFVTGSGAATRLWSTDGVQVGALPVGGDAGARLVGLTAAGGVAVFSADDGVTGLEPWRTDGTAQGTRRLGDLEPGGAGSSPARFFLGGDLLTFAASTLSHGEEPWALRVDTTPPRISVSPADAGGWFTSDVAVSFAVDDPESAVSRRLGCDGGLVSVDTAGQTFTCAAASEGGSARASVTVRRDATPPSFTSCPSDIAQEVTTPTATITYADAVAADALDPSPVVTYSPPRQDPFTVPGGRVTATATDHAGNTATCSFAVHLTSGATPTVTCLQTVVREPTDLSGLTVTSYPTEAVTASDPVDGAAVQLEFDPPAGGTFALDSTTPVKVTAVNSGGHRSTPCTFNLSITCTSADCRARTSVAPPPPKSRYAFGCQTVPSAWALWALATVMLLRRRGT